jgi:hypothetical protein
MTPTLGSIVQKGKFAACALALDKQLNNVDFPTLGSPTIPHFNAMIFTNYVFTIVSKSSAKLVQSTQKTKIFLSFYRFIITFVPIF